MNTVCKTCGDRGLEEALVHCDSCKIEAIHRYCLGITPVPYTESVTWICEGCDESDKDFDCKEVDQIVKLRHILKKSDTEFSNHTPPNLALEDHGFQDATNVKPLEVRSNPMDVTNVKPLEVHSEPMDATNVKPLEVHSEPMDATNVKPLEVHSSEIKEMKEKSKRRQSLDTRKPNDSTVLATDRPSVPKAENSARVPDINACTTNKRKLSSRDVLPCDNKQLADGKSPCKNVEPNTPLMSAGLTSRHCKAQPKGTPTWRGIISVKGEKISRLDGIAGHVSSLACAKVLETASSLHPELYAEMFPRLKLWPKSFLRSGGPKNESVALFFFPSSECNDEKGFYSLVLEMKKDDLAMKCELHDADLLLFTSNMLPTDSWNPKSDGYLWGVFKRRKTSRH